MSSPPLAPWYSVAGFLWDTVNELLEVYEVHEISKSPEDLTKRLSSVVSMATL